MFSILIVDDSISDREGIKGLIDWEALGIDVIGVAVDGLDGYNLAIKLKPDMILTDVAMPVMDGIKMTQKIKAVLQQTKFIFMSCFDDFEFLKGAINLDVYGYILKPIDLSELTEAIEKVKDLIQYEIDREQNEVKLRKQIQESKPILQERFIKDLLSGKLLDDNDIRERMDYLDMNFTYRYYSVIFLEIDDYNMLYPDVSTEKRHFLIYNIQKCIEETVLKEMEGYITDQQYNSIAIILFLNMEDNEEALSSIINSVNKCKELIHNQSGLNITIGISEFSNNLKVLPKVFETAEFAVKYKFYSGGNRIILASDVKMPEYDFQYDILDIKRKICLIIESGEEEDIFLFINHYYNSDLCYSAVYIKSLTFSIINVLQTILMERNESYGSVFGDELMIWNRLLRFETIVDIKQWLTGVIETVRQFFNKAENGRYRKIVEDIKNIIDERYAEIESVSQIVSQLYISASHANFIFKQQTGQTIFDYMMMKRMEYAKKMLLDPYIRVYEIAQKTGYKTNSYFTSVFKEYTGLTPKQFREKHF